MTGSVDGGPGGPGAGGPERPEEQAAHKAAALVSGMIAGLSRAEQLMVGGALLALVGGEWIFGTLLRGGGVASWVMVASAELMLAVWVKTRRPGVSWVLPYGLVLSALVVSVVVTEFSDLLAAIAGGQLTSETGVSLLSELCAWVGAAIMAWGAIDHWRSGRD
jgi:hypothetical protein